jgi:hypothetical protein
MVFFHQSRSIAARYAVASRNSSAFVCWGVSLQPMVSGSVFRCDFPIKQPILGRTAISLNGIVFATSQYTGVSREGEMFRKVSSW